MQVPTKYKIIEKILGINKTLNIKISQSNSSQSEKYIKTILL